MEYKVFLIAAVIFVFSQNANALKCYTCKSQLPNETCFTPIKLDEIPIVECNKSTINVNMFFSGPVDSQVLKAAENANEFECVNYEKHYINNNVTEMTRGCFPKDPAVTTCRVLNITSGIDAYNLTKCETCNTDLCNSSSNLQISGLLFLFVCVLRSALK